MIVAVATYRSKATKATKNATNGKKSNNSCIGGGVPSNDAHLNALSRGSKAGLEWRCEPVLQGAPDQSPAPLAGQGRGDRARRRAHRLSDGLELCLRLAHRRQSGARSCAQIAWH